jgi:hypothetical protein
VRLASPQDVSEGPIHAGDIRHLGIGAHVGGHQWIRARHHESAVNRSLRTRVQHVKASKLSSATAQTTGMQRLAAITGWNTASLVKALTSLVTSNWPKAFAVELCQLLDQVAIVQQDRPIGADGQRLFITFHRDTSIRRRRLGPGFSHGLASRQW